MFSSRRASISAKALFCLVCLIFYGIMNKQNPKIYRNPTVENYFRQSRNVAEINCLKLFSNDSNEHMKAGILEDEHAQSWHRDITDRLFQNLTTTTACERFRKMRGYIMDSLTSREEEFPLAYSILMYKFPEQVEQLLRAIYRPHNIYCIHIDKKANDAVKSDMVNIASCFNNVFISSRSIYVTWGTFTVLEPEIVCLQDLWKYKKWKYFINLTGQEFPLKTNYELVTILEAVEGANFVGVTRRNFIYSKWWSRAGLPPYELHPYKGSVHVAINRDFVDYILHSEVAHGLLDWTRKVQHGSEVFFNTLNHNPQLNITGSYRGFPEDSDFKPLITRYKLWRHPKLKCKLWKRGICILGMEQAPNLLESKHFFANKFYIEEQSFFTLQCLDELIYNRTRDEYLGRKTPFNPQYYLSLFQYKNKI